MTSNSKDRASRCNFIVADIVARTDRDEAVINRRELRAVPSLNRLERRLLFPSHSCLPALYFSRYGVT
jgi:hypothetical protein